MGNTVLHDKPPELRADSPDIQYADVFRAMEKGEAVNAMDAINVLWWKVGNQRREIARLHHLLAERGVGWRERADG